eukprot:s360_g15.t1
MDNWGTGDIDPGLLHPIWHETAKGSRVSVVLDGLLWDHDMSFAFSVPDGQPVRLIGLTKPCLECRRLTLIDAVVDFCGPFVDLLVTDDTCVIPHGHCSLDCLWNLVEVCSGIGASTTGFVKAGFRHVCSVELRPSLAELHRRLHEQVPVIVGDIANPGLLKEVHSQCKPPFTVAAGVSCQPYSSGGPQAGQHDERACTVPAVVKMAHLLQVPALVVECVTPARTNNWVRAHIELLVHVLGYHVTEISLRLEDVWTARRYRWWLVAVQASLGLVHVPPMPTGCGLVVRDLLPFTKTWSQEDMQQLCLTAQELMIHQQNGVPMSKYLLQVHDKLPTCLHSWGNQCGACPCGCRSDSFSESRLLSRGLYSQLLPVPPELGLGSFRHLHHCEVSLLNGFLPMQNWGPDARLNLAAIGQLASPLQSAWIGSCLKRHVGKLMGLETLCQPTDVLHAMKVELFAQSKMLYPPLMKQCEQHFTHIQLDQGPFMTIQVPSSATLAQLKQAEFALGLSTAASFVHADTGDDLMDSVGIAGLSIRVQTDPVESRPVVALPSLSEPFEAEAVSAVAVSDHVMQVCPTQVDLPDAEIMEVVDLLAAETRLEHDMLSQCLQLPPSGLLQMIPPLVANSDQCQALRLQKTNAQVRLDLLQRQDVLWGDDEIHWAFFESMLTTLHPEVMVIDPLLSQTWLTHSPREEVADHFRSYPHVRMVVTAVLSQEQWIPIVWTTTATELAASIWAHDEADVHTLAPLHAKVAFGLRQPAYTVACTRRSFGANLCGAAAVAFCEHVLNEKPLPMSQEALTHLHHQTKCAFAAYVQQTGVVPRPWFWGHGSSDTVQLLATLLQFHGVPVPQTQQRARLVMQSLGKDAVHQAITGSSPWKAIKQLANLHQPPVQLVLHDEQLAVTSKRPAKPKGKKGGGPRSIPVQPADIDPGMLTLDEGMFCTGPNEPLPQLSLSQVGPLSTGVAIANAQDVQPCLKSGALLTSKALAIIVLSQSDLDTTLQWSTIRFAARCSLNQEPMLLHGVLLQLGQKPVYQCGSNHSPISPTPAIACARVTVYADQWHDDWEDFCTRPVKHILRRLPMLVTCRTGAACQCPGWHPADDECDAILDVFRRNFFSDGGKPVKPDKAAYFCVFIRYAKQLETQVLATSGCQGIYLEPKTEDALQPHADYQVIWLPQLTFEEICHKARCEATGFGLARTGPRYGLRVKAADFPRAFANLKPDAVYLAPGQRVEYLCGPWPYGIDRKSLAKVFKEWGWAARPLQPQQGVQGGLMWAVQAISEPQQNVISMPHGQVVVSRSKPLQPPPTLSTPVIGPTDTVKLCSAKDAKSSVDPWLKDDPWKNALHATPLTVASASSTNALQELEQRLEQTILAKIPPPSDSMEVDGQEDRLQQLENQMNALAKRQSTLEVTVADNHAQSTAQVQSLQQQMAGQFEVQSKQLQTMLSDQMTRIETILAKKPRTE